MKNDRFTYLVNGWLAEKLTSEEINEFLFNLQKKEFQDYLGGEILSSLDSGKYNNLDTQQERERVLERLKTQIQINNKYIPAKKKSIWYYAVAAAVLLICFTVSYFLLFKDKSKEHIELSAVTYPTNNQAIIILPDGSKIKLDTLSNDIQFDKYLFKLTKSNIGLFEIENIASNNSGQASLPIKIFNPRGSTTLHFKLADGTHVWLNAQSSLSYPMVFSEQKREVELSGEAYFEVAKDTSKRFLVKTSQLTTEVLGTHFDIKAYDDEVVSKVTLLEGSVNIYHNKTSQVQKLKPRQQAAVSSNSINVKNANSNDVLAWKNELLSFNGSDIQTIMREISRWYDVEVEYGNITDDRKFSGYISRNTPLEDVLKILHKSGINFKTEGNKILVF